MLLCLVSNAHAMYSSKGPVKLLDAKGIREMQKDSGVWLVEFYAPWCGHCKNLAPEWKKAAKALDGVVNVAAGKSWCFVWFDCDQHKDLAAQFGVQGFPTIKIFGENKKKPTDYQGQRTAQGIVDAAIAESRKIVKARLSGGATKNSGSAGSKKKPSSSSNKGSKASNSDVVTLTDDNFDDLVLNSGDVWLVEFYAPWCGHCKALAPEWEQAASDLKGAVKLGALDATAHEQKAAEYGIRGFPTIKVFGPSASSASDAQDYQGARTASGITSYALQALEKLGGGLKIKELYSADVLTDFCSGKSSCVLAVLPHLTESGKAGREAYLSTLGDAAKLVRGKPFKFGWIQGGDQVAFENQFDLTFGYPSVVAINLDRKRFVVQRGAFSSDAIASFLQGVLQGKETTTGFDEFPKLATVEPWNGEDAKVEVIEDEDDDDILSEILGAGGDKDEL
ncbi:Protein disulfide-isomerase domain, partial [Globisporangium splendens]